MHVTWALNWRGPNWRRPNRRLLIRTGAGVAAVLAAVTTFGAVRAGSAPTTAADGFPLPSDAIFVAPGGSDTAAGTLDKPLATVRAAIAKASDGGTVVLRGGDYRQAIGDVTKRITLQNFRSEAATLTGTDVLRDWVPAGTAWRATGFTSALCQSCVNPAAIDPAHPLAGSPDQVFLNGTPLTQVASQPALKPGTFFVDQATKALYVGSNPSSGTVEASTRSQALRLDPGAAGSKLLGLRFTGFAPRFNQDQAAAVVVRAARTLVEGNTFTRTATSALGVLADNVTLRNNSVTDNGGAGAVVDSARGLVLSGNHFDRNNLEHFATAATACGVSCAVAGLKMSRAAGATLTGNTFDRNDANGLLCALDCTASTITGNQANGNTVGAIVWELSSRATMARNQLAGNGLGMKITGSDHVTITGNTFTGNATQLGMFDDPRAASIDGLASTLGLLWNTTNTVLTGNTFAGATNLLMDTNRHQVGAAQMFSALSGNAVSGVQKIVWCPSSCTAFDRLSAFQTATGLPFGTVGKLVAQYLPDPGFESGPLAWRTFGPATVLSLVPAAHSGLHALRVASSGTGPLVAGATGMPATLRTVAGHLYHATCWVRASAPATVRMQLQELTPAGLPAGDAVGTTVPTVDPATWYTVAVTYLAATTGNQLPLSVFSGDLLSRGSSLLVDDCSLTDG